MENHTLTPASASLDGFHHTPGSHTSPASVPSNSSRRKRSFATSPGRDESSERGTVENRRKAHKVSRACDICKSKKLKCTGTLPCESCTKKGILCIYDATYRRGRPPTPPPASPKPITPANGRRPREASILVVNPSVSGVPSATDNEGRLVSTEPSIVNHGDSSMHSASRASPELEMAEIEGQYFDPTSGLTFLHRAWKRLSSQTGVDAGVVPHVLSGAEQHQRLINAGDKPFAVRQDSLTLPDRDTAVELIQFYFEYCVVTYRCLHQDLVTSWLYAVLDNVHNSMPLHHNLGHAKAAIVLNILAIVYLRQDKIRVMGSMIDDDTSRLQRSDSYFCAATCLTDAETGLPKLESAQSRILQVLYLLQTSRMNQAWYVFGSILPIVSALGLHRRFGRKRNTGRGPKFDYIVSQCQKRTFWVAYTIDKYLAVVFGRPRLYHDEDIDQDFPDCVNDEDMTPQGRTNTEPKMDCHVDSLIFHAKLAQIIDNISREVYSIKRIPKHERLASANGFGRALHAWRESLPHHLGAVRPTSLIPSFRRQATALKLAYCHAIMHANRPFLLGTTGAQISTQGSGQTTSLEDSVGECINAAKTALETVDSMAADGTLFHAFWWTPYVTFCALAVVYVWEIQQGRASVDDDQNVAGMFDLAERCQNHLAQNTSPDSPSRRYSIILEELRLEAKRQSARQMGYAAVQGREQIDSLDDMPMQQLTGEVGQVFPGQGDNRFYGMPNLLNGWQTTDWLDLDSSAYGSFPDFEGTPMLWMSDVS